MTDANSTPHHDESVEAPSGEIDPLFEKKGYQWYVLSMLTTDLRF